MNTFTVALAPSDLCSVKTIKECKAVVQRMKINLAFNDSMVDSELI